MSTAPFPGAQPTTAAQHLAAIEEALALPVRRRANVDQARAIEKLGNAVDHLTYSHLFLNDKTSEKADADAIHILMRLKRRVFEECEKITPAENPLRQWLTSRVLKLGN
jgi:hypothetical protein